MANDDFDYYLIDCECFDDMPLLQDDDEFDTFGVGFLSQYSPVQPDYVAHITFGPPIPPKPRLSDAMSLRGDCSVFSKKIYDVLSRHPIKTLQLVPTLIRGKKGETFDNYWIANILLKMASFDEEKTEYGRISKVTGEWKNIKSIVLDKEKLAAVPLEDRLVFVSKENPAFIVYHKSVADIILSVNAEGIVFTPIEEYRRI
ncbi:imm11 family protein [Breznakiellaceae bacterium SP9]